MSEQTNSQIDGSILEKSPSKERMTKKIAPRKSRNTPTEKEVQTRGTIKQSDMVKWTVFVRPEVKIAVQKAAKKAGVTDTAWLDNRLWDAATADLSKKPQPPAKPEDVADLIGRVADQIKADQEAATLAQNALIAQQGAQLANLTQAVQEALNQPQPSLIDRIFGRAGKGKAE